MQLHTFNFFIVNYLVQPLYQIPLDFRYKNELLGFVLMKRFVEEIHLSGKYQYS